MKREQVSLFLPFRKQVFQPCEFNLLSSILNCICQYLTMTYRNLFGQEYCQGRKRVSKKEVKEAFDGLSEEKKAVRFFF